MLSRNSLIWVLGPALFIGVAPGAESAPAPSASLPLVLVADVALPGRPVRFDYQDMDTAPGSASHTVAVDSASHRVFFPLSVGPNGVPVLRIMRPTGT